VLTLRERLREETKNLLEAKTSEELIAGYEKIMSIINAQIEVNNTELEEIKAQLLSVKKENQTNYEKLQRRKEELEDLGERLE
jgi:dynactin complex subunit